jgi:hypothetical protein
MEVRAARSIPDDEAVAARSDASRCHECLAVCCDTGAECRRRAGLVTTRREGYYVLYAVSRERILPLSETVLEFLGE